MIKTLFVWLVIIVLNIIGVMFFVPPDAVINSSKNELVKIQSWMGEEAYVHLNNQTYITYNNLFVKTGIQDESFKIFIPTKEQKDKSGQMKNMNSNAFLWLQDKIKMFWNMIYFGILRFHHFVFWFPIILPFMIASIIDGVYTRKIKLISFTLTSAARYGSSMHVIIFLSIFPVFLFIYPWTINPVVIPFWYITFSFFLRLLASNLQKV